ncbi:unnamed protein product, partial [Prorocentrum cordatum]
DELVSANWASQHGAVRRELVVADKVYLRFRRAEGNVAAATPPLRAPKGPRAAAEPHGHLGAPAPRGRQPVEAHALQQRPHERGAESGPPWVGGPTLPEPGLALFEKARPPSAPRLEPKLLEPKLIEHAVHRMVPSKLKGEVLPVKPRSISCKPHATMVEEERIRSTSHPARSRSDPPPKSWSPWGSLNSPCHSGCLASADLPFSCSDFGNAVGWSRHSSPHAHEQVSPTDALDKQSLHDSNIFSGSGSGSELQSSESKCPSTEWEFSELPHPVPIGGFPLPLGAQLTDRSVHSVPSAQHGGREPPLAVGRPYAQPQQHWQPHDTLLCGANALGVQHPGQHQLLGGLRGPPGLVPVGLAPPGAAAQHPGSLVIVANSDALAWQTAASFGTVVSGGTLPLGVGPPQPGQPQPLQPRMEAQGSAQVPRRHGTGGAGPMPAIFMVPEAAASAASRSLPRADSAPPGCDRAGPLSEPGAVGTAAAAAQAAGSAAGAARRRTYRAGQREAAKRERALVSSRAAPAADHGVGGGLHPGPPAELAPASWAQEHARPAVAALAAPAAASSSATICDGEPQRYGAGGGFSEGIARASFVGRSARAGSAPPDCRAAGAVAAGAEGPERLYFKPRRRAGVRVRQRKEFAIARRRGLNEPAADAAGVGATQEGEADPNTADGPAAAAATGVAAAVAPVGPVRARARWADAALAEGDLGNSPRHELWPVSGDAAQQAASALEVEA